MIKGGGASARPSLSFFFDFNVFLPSPSSAQRTISVIGDAWTLRILRTVFRGQRRYSDFLSELGISRAVLTDRLGKLVANELLIRHAIEGGHPEYRLTERGLDLWPMFLAMWLWETEWGTGVMDDVPPVEQPRPMLMHTVCGHKMRPQLECQHCSVVIQPFDTQAEAGPGYLHIEPGTQSMFRRASQNTLAEASAAQGHTLMRVIGDRWNSALLAAAFKGLKLFSEFEKDLRIGPNQLSDRLGELLNLGILRARSYSGARQEYRLTRKGVAMFPIVLEMMRWGDKWLWPATAPIVLRHKPCDHLLVGHWHCGHCKMQLSRTEIHLF